MAALDTPLAACDCDGQAQQPKPEQHMGTRDSDLSGIRVWEKPQGKPLRPAEGIEWMVEEGDDGFRSWAGNSTAGARVHSSDLPLRGSPQEEKSTRALGELALTMEGELHLRTAWGVTVWSVQMCST